MKRDTAILIALGIGTFYWLNNTTTGKFISGAANVIVDPFGSFIAQEKSWFDTWTFGLFK